MLYDLLIYIYIINYIDLFIYFKMYNKPHLDIYNL
jgi:hypothetical protein